MTHREAQRRHRAMHPDSTPISIFDGATSLHATGSHLSSRYSCCCSPVKCIPFNATSQSFQEMKHQLLLRHVKNVEQV